MGFAEKQVWLDTVQNNPMEPVFVAGAEARISVAEVNIANGQEQVFETALLSIAQELWLDSGLNDFKILKGQSGHHYLLICSWNPEEDEPRTESQDLHHILKPLIAEGLITRIEHQTDNFQIIE